MPWDDKPGKKPKNPWGQGGDDNNRGPWGGGPSGGGNSGGGGEPPDIDAMLRKAQENFRTIFPSQMKGGFIAALALGAIAVLWLSSGLYVVNPAENAVIQRFGKWSSTQTQPGLGYHLPAPIETATLVNVQEIRKMSIGFIDSYSRSGASGQTDLPEESLMLTADRNIVDLDLVIQWNIKSAENFLFSIKDQEYMIKKVSESAIREVIGQTNMFTIITSGRDTVADRAKQIIQQSLDQYNSGINITQVLIERAEVHPQVQAAFQDVQSAKQDAEDVQNRAKAYREDIIPKARGQAIQMIQQAEAYQKSTVAKADGDAERFNAIYEAYLTGQDVTKERLFIETMEEVLQNSSKIILDSKAGAGAVPYLPLNELKKRSAPAAEPKSDTPDLLQ